MRIRGQKAVPHKYDIDEYAPPDSLLRTYANLAKAYPPLTKDAEWELAVKASEGDEQAKLLLFKHNATRLLRFANKLGKREHKVYCEGDPVLERTCPTPEEVLCWACEGLWWAIEHFDPRRAGARGFTGWANGTIEKFILRYRARRDRRDRNYRLATFVLGHKLGAQISEEAGRDPVCEQLARERFIRLCESVLPEDERRHLFALLGWEAGPPPENEARFIEKVAAKLRQATDEHEWEFLKRWLTQARA